MAESSDRVGVYLKPGTRNRLNKFKADLSFVIGEIVPLDEAINILLDHAGEQIIKESSTNGHPVKEVA